MNSKTTSAPPLSLFNFLLIAFQKRRVLGVMVLASLLLSGAFMYGLAQIKSTEQHYIFKSSTTGPKLDDLVRDIQKLMSMDATYRQIRGSLSLQLDAFLTIKYDLESNTILKVIVTSSSEEINKNALSQVEAKIKELTDDMFVSQERESIQKWENLRSKLNEKLTSDKTGSVTLSERDKNRLTIAKFEELRRLVYPSTSSNNKSFQSEGRENILGASTLSDNRAVRIQLLTLIDEEIEALKAISSSSKFFSIVNGQTLKIINKKKVALTLLIALLLAVFLFSLFITAEATWDEMKREIPLKSPNQPKE